MDSQAKDFLFTLLKTPSPTGFESAGQKVWLKEVAKYADETANDAYGSAWGILKGGSKKTLMLEAHCDEIGYMVKHLLPGGFLAIDLIGGSDAATARGRRVTIFGEKGEVQGIIGNIAIHIRERKEEKAPEVHDLIVDIGAKNEKEVAAMGVRVGCPMVYSETVSELGKNGIIARALDNRLGGFIIAEVMKNLSQGKKPAWNVVALNAVQEEIGCYGARMATYRLSPDAAIAFDVTHATDTPGIKNEKHGKVELRKGPTVTHGGCNHPNIVERLTDVAKKKKIPFQHEAASRFSGTDTGVIYLTKEGIPSALVSLPLRYMHSAVETVDIRDVEQTILLLTGFVQSLTVKDEFGMKIVV
ncbi:MAG TPA: M42 family metallopeptidase [Candidatus Peribacterales bacterium]|nr:M42 family metallopeptidase [Candidatus Peribacterales bacterium]